MSSEPVRPSVLPSYASSRPTADWLLNGSRFKAGLFRGASESEIVLSNGLVSRFFRLSPNAATVGFQNLRTGESLIRGVKPEARITLDGVDYDVGGLKGQPNYAFLRPEWVETLKADPTAFQFAGCEVGRQVRGILR